MKNKIKEIILAGAIGDAFGFLIEFDNLDKIKYKYGADGLNIKYLGIDEWVVSDDTQMTFFCLDSITPYLNTYINDIDPINIKIYKSYLEWNKTQIFKSGEEINSNSFLANQKNMRKKQAPGLTCLQALGSKKMGTIEKPINDSKGCGTIMRTAPVSFLNSSLENIFLLGAKQGAITHGNPDGYLSAGFFSVLLKLIIEGKNLDEAFNLSMSILEKDINHTNLKKYLLRIKEYSLSDKRYERLELNNIIGNGFVAEEALGIAYYCVKKGNSFEDTLWLSANHNGDSDSTASLAAQLYVALNGLPNNFKSSFKYLDVKNEFSYLMNQVDKFLI